MLLPMRWARAHGRRLLMVLIPLALAVVFLFFTRSLPNEIAPLKSAISKVHQSSPISSGSTKASSSNSNSGASSKDVFVSQLLAHNLNPEFDAAPLTELCASKEWNQGLIFSCASAEGGIGNVRNIFLNCVRYAIEAGATTFVIPNLIPLQKNARYKPEHVPFSYYFDIDHFKNELSLACPEMRFLYDTNSLWDKPSTSPAISIAPEALDRASPINKQTYHQKAYLNNPADWSDSFRARVDKLHPVPYSPEQPIHVTLKSPLLLQWPLTHDTPAFVTNFGLLLKFNHEIREMAGRVLYALDKTHRLRVDPLLDGNKVQKGQFYGAHLRTGPDAIAAGWTSYKIQARNYILAASKAELNLIYLVSDDREDTIQFVEEARLQGIEVTNSVQALNAAALKGEMDGEKRKLAGMDVSIRSCVDWLVLSRASGMGGIWQSSFSWGVAMVRHKGVEGARWGVAPDESIDQKHEKVTRAIAVTEKRYTPGTTLSKRQAGGDDADEQTEPVGHPNDPDVDIDTTLKSPKKSSHKPLPKEPADDIDDHGDADLDLSLDTKLANVEKPDPIVEEADEDDALLPPIDPKKMLKAAPVDADAEPDLLDDHGDADLDLSLDSKLADSQKPDPIVEEADDDDALLPPINPKKVPKLKTVVENAEDDREAQAEAEIAAAEAAEAESQPKKKQPSSKAKSKSKANVKEDNEDEDEVEDEKANGKNKDQAKEDPIIVEIDADAEGEELEKATKAAVADYIKKEKEEKAKEKQRPKAKPKAKPAQGDSGKQDNDEDKDEKESEEDTKDDDDAKKSTSPSAKSKGKGKEKPQFKEGEPRVPEGEYPEKPPGQESFGEGLWAGDGGVVGDDGFGDDDTDGKVQAFEDGLSTIFGPQAEGEMFWGGMWP